MSSEVNIFRCVCVYSTVRIWDYTQDACINVLSGHKAPVRGLLWNTEVPYLLISGKQTTSGGWGACSCVLEGVGHTTPGRDPQACLPLPLLSSDGVAVVVDLVCELL